jgi:hypothetical protein
MAIWAAAYPLRRPEALLLETNDGEQCMGLSTTRPLRLDVEAAIREDDERTTTELLVEGLRALIEGGEADEVLRCGRVVGRGRLPSTTPFVIKRGR